MSRTGGRGTIHKDKHRHIDFVGIIPNYSICYINSALFFPVVQYDTRFQTSISKGHLYTMVTLTGARTILPLAIAWAPSESLFYSEMFLQLFTKDELSRIKSCISDQSQALISSIEKVDIKSLLCFWHLMIHCPKYCKSSFAELAKSQTSQDYFEKKQHIIESEEELKAFLDQKSYYYYKMGENISF